MPSGSKKKRLTKYSLDKENRKQYAIKKEEWRKSSAEELEIFQKNDRILSIEGTIDKAKKLADLHEYESASSFQDIWAITNKKLGYDGIPIVVTDNTFEKLSEGRTKLYRGVHSGNGKTSGEIVREFMYGPLWTGNSGGAIAGNSVYFTATESIAKSAEYRGLDRNVFEMIFADDGKGADYLEIGTEFEKTGISKIIGIPEEDYQCVICDVGQYAAVKGYVAIVLNEFNNHDYVVLLNRKKAIVKEVE